MALSPSHRFGQIIGDMLEAAVEPLLQGFADDHSLYLDKKGSRPARPRRKKCTWIDLNGNAHDLDFVLERGGTADQIGSPVAFIEAAWRRYTKHSKNKAQEIQGAVLPLLETFRGSAPFAGVILAGDFTAGALIQLRSLGFSVLHFPYDQVVQAFREVGIDAQFDEHTPDADLEAKVRIWGKLSASDKDRVAKAMIDVEVQEVQGFISELARKVGRYIETVLVTSLHGRVSEWSTITEAVEFIEQYGDTQSSHPLIALEISIRYSNGDRIDGRFAEKAEAIGFLRTYQPQGPP